MTGFGDDLRRERESRNVSLEQICEQTKIGKRHLIALEAENFKAMPGGVFNKGILRAYLQHLGLQEAPWMERFLAAYRESDVAPTEDENWLAFSTAAHGAAVPIQNRRLRWIGAFVLLLLLVGIGLVVWHYLD